MNTDFVGIAFGARKGGGKDTALDYLTLNRNVEVVRCKQPIVDLYLELRNSYPAPHDTKRLDREYVKSRDDADLIWYSTNVIRKQDPTICSRYLHEHIPKVIERGNLPVVPDMRRKEENDALYSELAERGFPILCIKLEAPMEVLIQRTIDRDGDLRNWKPDDATEREVDELRYHYIVSNGKNEMRPLVMQLEGFLGRFKQLQRTKPYNLTNGVVRVVNPADSHFWETFQVVDDEDESPNSVTVMVKKQFLRTEVIDASGGCFS